MQQATAASAGFYGEDGYHPVSPYVTVGENQEDMETIDGAVADAVSVLGNSVASAMFDDNSNFGGN